MKLIYLIIAVCFFSLTANAQTKFIVKGKIEFEKKVNMWKNLGDDDWQQEMKKRMPEFSTTYYDLRFDEHQSTFKPGKEVDDPWKKNNWFGSGDEDNNIIYNNYDSVHTIAQRQVFEKLYRLEDTLMKIEWRITSDTRTIAGFDCRKAIGKMFDTLYVVAFYTDQIITPGGPANYTGLPGMILGIGFPRFGTTIFATKLELVEPTAKELAIPTKGKKIARAELMTQVKAVFNNRWAGNDWQKYFWPAVL